VNQLGELLELLHAGSSRYKTFAATYSLWERPGVKWKVITRAMAALPRNVTRGQAGHFSGTFSSHPADDELVQDDEESGSLTVVVEPPDRYREDIRSGGEVALLVRDGVSWWDYNEHLGVSTNTVDAEPWMSRANGEYEALGEPSALPALLELEPLGFGERAGRRVIRARGLPRGAEQRGDHRALAAIGGLGADEYELEFDAERAVVLFAAARVGGSEFSIVEANVASFDEPFGGDAFLFSPPAE
jgi:hypothetical protein